MFWGSQATQDGWKLMKAAGACSPGLPHLVHPRGPHVAVRQPAHELRQRARGPCPEAHARAAWAHRLRRQRHDQPHGRQRCGGGHVHACGASVQDLAHLRATYVEVRPPRSAKQQEAPHCASLGANQAARRPKGAGSVEPRSPQLSVHAKPARRPTLSRRMAVPSVRAPGCRRQCQMSCPSRPNSCPMPALSSSRLAAMSEVNSKAATALSTRSAAATSTPPPPPPPPLPAAAARWGPTPAAPPSCCAGGLAAPGWPLLPPLPWPTAGPGPPLARPPSTPSPLPSACPPSAHSASGSCRHGTAGSVPPPPYTLLPCCAAIASIAVASGPRASYRRLARPPRPAGPPEACSVLAACPQASFSLRVASQTASACMRISKCAPQSPMREAWVRSALASATAAWLFPLPAPPPAGPPARGRGGWRRSVCV
jgi:hypothetical protein